MEYRVLEIGSSSERDPLIFESAYDAVDFITACWYRGDSRAQHLYIVDSEGSILLRPEDVIGAQMSDWSTASGEERV